MNQLFVRIAILTLMMFSAHSAVASVKTITWDDLIPEEAKQKVIESQQQDFINHSGSGPAKQAQHSELSMVRTDLDGTKIKLPGFIVPLDGNDTKITEFLLVPYFGACIHVPPPPVNQLVHVFYPDGLSPEWLYSPIWIQGPLKSGEVKSEIATSGYSMIATNVELYEQ